MDSARRSGCLPGARPLRAPATRPGPIAGASLSGARHLVHSSRRVRPLRSTCPRADIWQVLLGSGSERDALRAQLAQAHAARGRARAPARRAPQPRPPHAPAGTRRLPDRRGGSDFTPPSRPSTPVSVLVIDIDGFRELNARRGAPAGDAALAGLASQVREHTRESDVLGRSGADEITILMPGTDLQGAQVCCDRLLHALSDRPSFPRPGRSRSRRGSRCTGSARAWETSWPPRRPAWTAPARSAEHAPRPASRARTRPTSAPPRPPSSKRSRTRWSSATATPASTPRTSSSSCAASDGSSAWTSRRSRRSPPRRCCTTSARSRSRTPCCTSPER